MADLNAMLQQARAADEKGDFATSIGIYTTLIAQAPAQYTPQLILQKAVACYNSQKFDDAGACFQQAITLIEAKPEAERDVQVLSTAYSGLAKVLNATQKYERALPLFEKYLALDPKGTQLTYVLYAQCAVNAGKFADVLRITETALGKKEVLADPSQVFELHNSRIISLFRMDRPTECIPSVEAMLKIKPVSQLRSEHVQVFAEVYNIAGQQMHDAKKFAEAKALFTKMNDLNRTAGSMFLLGVTEISLGNNAAAKKVITLATDLLSQETRNLTKDVPPNAWKYFYALGLVNMKDDPSVQDFNQAVDCFQQALKLSAEANNHSLHFNNGFALVKLGRDSEAKPSLEFCWKNEPRNWVAPALLGTIYIKEERYEDAIEALTHAIEVANGEADDSVYFNLAYAYMMLNRFKEAAKWFNEAFKKNPNNAAAKNAAERMEKEFQAEEVRRIAEEAEREKARLVEVERAKKEQEAIKLAAEAKSKAEKEKAERMRKEAEQAKAQAEEQRVLKIQQARERRIKRLEELRVLAGGPQGSRARRKSLEVIPMGNTDKNAHAYADWYNEKVVGPKPA